MSQRSQMVTFFLTCPEPRAWLVIRSDHHASRVIEMWQGYPNHWSASAWLDPGEYCCRYYCGDEKHVIYYGPAHLSDIAGQGMDGLVLIADSTAKAAPHGINILVVEDNLTTLMALEKRLRMDGYVVHAAEGYQTALEIAKKQKVDLAICDINLWDGDGCDLIRELQLLQTMKAIAVTGYTLPEETEHYREAGFAVVLRKPIHHSQVTSALAFIDFASAPGLPTTPFPLD